MSSRGHHRCLCRPFRRVTLRALTSIALAYAIVAAPAGVGAQGAASPPPAMRPECGIGVREVVPIGPGPQTRSTGTQFFVYLWSPQPAHTVSGTLWINASGVAYHAAFTGVRVSPSREKPVAIRLPAEASLEDVFVDTLGDVSTGACGVANAWTPAIPPPADPELKNLETQAVDSLVDSRMIADAIHACHAPDVPGFVISAVEPEVPKAAIAAHIEGSVDVLVVLRPDSTVRAVSVLKSSDPMFRDEALRVARTTIFRTEVHACQPAIGRFTFNVHFVKE